MIDLIPYIGIVSLIVASVCGIVVLKKNGILLKKFKHNKTEVEFDRSEQTAMGPAADALERVNVLHLRVQLSSDAEQDCKTLGLAYEEPIHFVLSEAERHPLLFKNDFTSVSLVFHENVLLLSWGGSVATIERILDRREAYPLNDDWSECLSVYRQASLLPYRTKGPENLQTPKDAQRTFAVFRRLVSKANGFLESLRRNHQRPFEAFGDMNSLLEEAKFALESSDLPTAAARLEVVLSTVHKLILQNAPQGPLSSRCSPKTTIIEIPPDVKGTILLVDDEKAWLSGMSQLLESKNFAIVVASNTVDALRAIVDHEFDIVVTDLVMGLESNRLEADGREVALAAKKGSLKTKVIVLTGYQQMSLEASLFESGVDVIIFKTEPAQDILHKIESTLAKIEKPRLDR